MAQLNVTVRLILTALAAGIGAAAASVGEVPSGWRAGLAGAAAALAALGIVPPHLPTMTSLSEPLPTDAQEFAAPPPPESATVPDPPPAVPQQGT